MLPYSITNQPRRTALTLIMLTALSVAPVAGIESDVASFTVAPSTMLTLLHDQPVRLFLQARYEKGRAATAAGSVLTERIQITGDGRRMIRSSRNGREFPAIAHPDVIAFTRIAQGAWVPARVMAANFDTGWVDVEVPSNAGAVRVYYVFGDGEISLRASRPFGSSSGSVQLWKGSARGLHETDQTDRDTAPYLTRSPKPIPQNFRLLLTVRATSAVYLDGLAQHEIMLPVSETAIQVHDAVALADMAERQLKGA